ncbi:MAG: twin-arginine translocation signal domain-containing protein [Wohlfahrtiimonas sp.]
MNYVDKSRRSFLKMGSLLTIGVALTPAMAIFSSHKTNQNHSDTSLKQDVLPIRSDVRSLDFDSHNFLLNFRH